MKYIIGIGNPGTEYENTRHNVGFLVVDELRKRASGIKTIKWRQDKSLKALIAEFNQSTTLTQSTLFVNNTGGTVAAIVKKEGGFDRSNFLFVCDDVNLDFGKMRLRDSGSAGGHHGLENIIQELNHSGFNRLRIGIRTESMPRDLPQFVLDRFSPEEEKELGKILDKAGLICEAWANDGFDAARTRLSQLQSSNKAQ